MILFSKLHEWIETSYFMFCSILSLLFPVASALMSWKSRFRWLKLRLCFLLKLWIGSVWKTKKTFGFCMMNRPVRPSTTDRIENQPSHRFENFSGSDNTGKKLTKWWCMCPALSLHIHIKIQWLPVHIHKSSEDPIQTPKLNLSGLLWMDKLPRQRLVCFPSELSKTLHNIRRVERIYTSDDTYPLFFQSPFGDNSLHWFLDFTRQENGCSFIIYAVDYQ